MSEIKCVVCHQPCTGGVSQFAAYGGLPSPCCKYCFEVNDYTCDSVSDVQVKSLVKRFNDGVEPVKENK